MLLTNLKTLRSKSNNLVRELINEVTTTTHRVVGMKMSSGELPNKLEPKNKPVQLRREKQLQAAKKKTTPYVPGTVSLQVLGSGANGAPTAVYLFTDQSRYLFNCGEGTQRLAHEHKTKLARLEQIFVTRNTWPMIGGFPGLALTVQDAGVRELALHGPPHLDSILHSMKRFVVLNKLQVKTKDCTQLQEFEDSVMLVKCVPLFGSDTLSTAISDKVVIAYICKLKPRPGALNLDKCVQHGVPPGPLLGLLKNGIDVTLDNGTVIRSKDVSEPGEKALSFIFIDIPAEHFLSALQAQSELFHDLPANDPHEVALVVHFSPEHMLENNCYRDFMQKFSKKTQHIYLNSPTNSFSGYIAAHRIQYQLHQLNPNVFPLLGESANLCNSLSISSKLKKTKLIEDREEVEEVSIDNDVTEPPSEVLANINSMTNFHLRPRKGLDRALEAKLTPSEYINETQILEGFPELLGKLKENYKSLNIDRTEEDYPKITFLGTGSCIPNKTRNVSGILVQAHESAYMLLDCGEGTLGQIVRFYGKTKAEEVIRNLEVIYVSHLHADHHIGLIGLLNERQRLLNGLATGKENKLLLLAPRQIEPWLNFYNERIAGISDAYELIGNADMLEKPLDMGSAIFATCMVRHCPHSFGVSLTFKTAAASEPVKITYSGDTMPCQDLIDLGHNSTILIHEATMEDDLVDEAKIKMHSTISQAVQQGRQMNAKHIILTHFSQRYAKMPRMQSNSAEAEAEAMHNVAIAFDNMQVTLRDLQHFHVLYPALKALFAEHAEELEQKALKRELKLERKRKLMNAD